MIDGQALVYRIEKDSTAEKSGLKTGFAIKKIDGKTVEELLAPLEKGIAERNENEKVKMIYRERTLAFYLQGKPATIVKIEALNAKNAPQIFDVPRYATKTEMSEAVGNFPAQEVVFEAKRLENNIGYIRFNMWVIPQLPKIRQAIRDFADTKGIIFDLRGNPGGIGGLAPGVAGLFMNEQSSLGSMTGRDTDQKFIVYPQSNPFPGKIMILSDYGTGSTSEIFAAGLQDIGRARVIGETSAGAVLPSVFDTLPTGAIFQYAISDYKSTKKVLIEGRVVVPYKVVKQTRQALLDGRDLQLETAIKLILN
jgi:carboxyl-terminal processing protease